MSENRPQRPEPLELIPENVPSKLREHEQWVAWRYRWKPDRGEWTKIPVNPHTGDFASSTDAETWGSFADAVAYHADDATASDGVGFVVTDDDLFVGLDFDDCRDAESEDVEPWVQEIVDDAETYAEWSPSGTGARAFGVGFLPDGGTRGDVDDANGHIEMYETGRYLTVTGHQIDGAADDVEHFDEKIQELHAEYIADDPPEVENTGSNGHLQADSDDANPTPDAELSDFSDAELVEKAKNAENGDKFRRLYRGDISGYPSHSEARQAFANLLAFWTGGDERRMLRIFKNSDLYRGDDDERTFTEYEIPTALSSTTEFFEPGSGKQTETAPDPQPPQEPDAESDRYEARLNPQEVCAVAGLGEDGSISDLDDRERAAVVWDLIHRHPDFHIRVRRDNGSLWSFDGGIWKPEGERTLRHAGRKALGSMNYGANVLTELKAQAKSDPRIEVEPDEMGVDAGFIAVKNGLLDLRAAADGDDDALRELRPDDLALRQLPVEYDPDATAAEWNELVDEWAEQGRADALQEYVGYCLHAGGMPIHRALLLVGSGANGKGTFLHIVRELLGSENTSSIELQTLANEKDARAQFHRSIANIDDDLSARQIGSGLGMFKKLVAGEHVRARHLYEDGFEYQATGKHLYAANEVPDVEVPDDDEAFWRRWLLVEFPNHYPPSERDHQLRDRLTDAETLSGVLNWAVDGWKRLLDAGKFTGEETSAHEKRQRWQRWGESISEFIVNCVERDEDADRKTTGEVHEVFNAWTRENNKDRASQRGLTNKLKAEDLGYSNSIRIGGKPQRGFDALGFTDEAPDVDELERDDEPDDGSHQSSL